MMNCSRCKKDLDFEENVLKKFVACPFCGAFFPKVLPAIEPNSVVTELKKLAEDFGGLEIFKEENATKFAKSLMTISAPFDAARDKLLVANIRRIPQKLYSVVDASKNEQQRMTDFCLDELMAFDIPEKFAKDVVLWLTTVMQMPVSMERKLAVEQKKSVTTVGIKYSRGYGDSEIIKYKYKTCIIGNQEWFAENFKENNGKNENYDDKFRTIGKEIENPELGRLYDWHEAKKNAPEGWRLPTIEDFQDLNAYIKSLGYDAGSALKSSKMWHGKADLGLDLFGFCACPPTRDSETGISQAWFWTSSETGSADYPHYCVLLDADNNEIFLNKYAINDHYACVRYVRDVK